MNPRRWARLAVAARASFGCDLRPKFQSNPIGLKRLSIERFESYSTVCSWVKFGWTSMSYSQLTQTIFSAFILFNCSQKKFNFFFKNRYNDKHLHAAILENVIIVPRKNANFFSKVARNFIHFFMIKTSAARIFLQISTKNSSNVFDLIKIV